MGYHNRAYEVPVEQLEEEDNYGVMTAICDECGFEDFLEPDGICDCPECGAKEKFASLYVILGVI